MVRLIVFLLTLAGTAQAQRLTEMYIPIGKSPGLSGKHTFAGAVVSVDTSLSTLTVSDGTSSMTARITDSTWIWLDRNKLKLTNIRGSLTDCLPGRMAEIKFVRNERLNGGNAHWVKIEVSGP
jgi:hypothetical protein